MVPWGFWQFCKANLAGKRWKFLQVLGYANLPTLFKTASSGWPRAEILNTKSTDTSKTMFSQIPTLRAPQPESGLNPARLRAELDPTGSSRCEDWSRNQAGVGVIKICAKSINKKISPGLECGWLWQLIFQPGFGLDIFSPNPGWKFSGWNQAEIGVSKICTKSEYLKIDPGLEMVGWSGWVFSPNPGWIFPTRFRAGYF